jgi:hypothetical protein
VFTLCKVEMDPVRIEAEILLIVVARILADDQGDELIDDKISAARLRDSGRDTVAGRDHGG